VVLPEARSTGPDDIQIDVGDAPWLDLLAMGRERRGFQEMDVSHVTPHFPETPEDEGRALCEVEYSESDRFLEARDRFRVEFRAIMEWIVRTYSVCLDKGVDFGCGNRGEMVNQWLCLGPDQAKSWTQVDLHPRAVQGARFMYPDQTFREGSFFEAQKLGLTDRTVAMGLSALDTTAFPERAVEGIASTVKSGGFLLFVQDVPPHHHPVFKQLAYMDCPLTKAEFATSAFGSVDKRPTTLWTGEDEGFLGFGELYRRSLVRAIKNAPSVKLVLDQWVTAHRVNPVPLAVNIGYHTAVDIEERLQVGSPRINTASVIVALAQKCQ